MKKELVRQIPGFCPECQQPVAIRVGKRLIIEKHISRDDYEKFCPLSTHPMPAELEHPKHFDNWSIGAQENYRNWKAVQELRLGRLVKRDVKRPCKPSKKHKRSEVAPVLCKTGKRSFKTEDVAEQAVTAVTKSNLRKNRLAGRTGCRSYKCQHCDMWHVTSLPTWTKSEGAT